MTRSRANPAIDAGMRQTLAGLADLIVPAAEDMPAATEVDVPGEWLDRALAAMPAEAESGLAKLLTDVGGQNADTALQQVQTSEEDFNLLLAVVTGAYYLHPVVRDRLGYPGQTPHALLADADVSETPSYLVDGRLQRVKDRGPIFRPTPTA